MTFFGRFEFLGLDNVLIKDLKLEGGSKSKPIRLVDGDHEIDCKVEGIAVGLKACFVKKA